MCACGEHGIAFAIRFHFCLHTEVRRVRDDGILDDGHAILFDVCALHIFRQMVRIIRPSEKLAIALSVELLIYT